MIGKIVKGTGMPKSKIDAIVQHFEEEDCYTEKTFFKFTQGDLDALYKKANLTLAVKRQLQEKWETQFLVNDAAIQATNFNHKVAYIFW